VEGAQTLSPMQAFTEAHVPARTNIFWMMLHQPFVRRLQADPVVSHASRSMELPNTLVLRVAERQPVATLALDHQYWLLDAQGVPFRLLTEPYPGVPMVAPQSDVIQGQALSADTISLGKPVKAVWLRQTYSLMALIATDQKLAAAKIKVDQNGNLCLNRKDNLQIFLGQADALPEKVALAQAAIAADGGVIARRASYIDVSCPQQPVWMPRMASRDDNGQDEPGGVEP
jgi:cell division septal protein FtsQ